MTLKHMPIGVQ